MSSADEKNDLEKIRGLIQGLKKVSLDQQQQAAATSSSSSSSAAADAAAKAAMQSLFPSTGGGTNTKPKSPAEVWAASQFFSSTLGESDAEDDEDNEDAEDADEEDLLEEPPFEVARLHPDFQVMCKYFFLASEQIYDHFSKDSPLPLALTFENAAHIEQLVYELLWLPVHGFVNDEHNPHEWIRNLDAKAKKSKK